jgi:hypothetical protein
MAAKTEQQFFLPLERGKLGEVAEGREKGEGAFFFVSLRRKVLRVNLGGILGLKNSQHSLDKCSVSMLGGKFDSPSFFAAKTFCFFANSFKSFFSLSLTQKL